MFNQAQAVVHVLAAAASNRTCHNRAHSTRWDDLGTI